MHHMAVIDNSFLPWKRDIGKKSFTVDASHDDLAYHIHSSNYSEKPYQASQSDRSGDKLHHKGFDTLIQAVNWCEKLANQSAPKSLKNDVKIVAGDYAFEIKQRSTSIVVDYCKPYLSAHSASFKLTPSQARELAQSLIDFADIMDIKGIRI